MKNGLPAANRSVEARKYGRRHSHRNPWIGSLQPLRCTRRAPSRVWKSERVSDSPIIDARNETASARKGSTLETPNSNPPNGGPARIAPNCRASRRATASGSRSGGTTLRIAPRSHT